MIKLLNRKINFASCITETVVNYGIHKFKNAIILTKRIHMPFCMLFFFKFYKKSSFVLHLF